MTTLLAFAAASFLGALVVLELRARPRYAFTTVHGIRCYFLGGAPWLRVGDVERETRNVLGMLSQADVTSLGLASLASHLDGVRVVFVPALNDAGGELDAARRRIEIRTKLWTPLSDMPLAQLLTLQMAVADRGSPEAVFQDERWRSVIAPAQVERAG